MARPKGSRNKPKRALLALLQEQYPNYHPVLEMARIAHDTEDESIRANMHKEVAKYVEPMLKAVEVTGDEGGPVKVVIEWQSNG